MFSFSFVIVVVFPVQVCLFHVKVTVTIITGFVCRNLSLFQAKLAITTIRCLFFVVVVLFFLFFFCFVFSFSFFFPVQVFFVFHAKWLSRPLRVLCVEVWVNTSLSRYKSERFTLKWLSTPHGFCPYKSGFCVRSKWLSRPLWVLCVEVCFLFHVQIWVCFTLKWLSQTRRFVRL